MDTLRPSTRVWQAPIRIFHWALVICICGAFWTALISHDHDLHVQFGTGALGLVIFRVIWAFFGRWPGRIFDFSLSPLTLLKYLKIIPSKLKGPKPPLAGNTPGHNPLGAIGVLLMLTGIGIQAISGLTLDDDILFVGPLREYFGKETLAFFASFHAEGLLILGTLIGLHILAVIFHQIKGEPMLKKISIGEITPRPSSFPTEKGQGWGVACVAGIISTLICFSLWNLEQLLIEINWLMDYFRNFL